ncbi:response regulator transcription factor [Paenibacillus segetis]|uniref:DNA-binding response regulator n=1 Tax=Paenibacillus segetis TaxID=1325360 RepID=A0ABQ1YSR3_9BACL|nr:response regulator [Paenibacillus segetis]GGH36480.1 DNA-binding response regulator [Paenibacillus segetis]
MYKAIVVDDEKWIVEGIKAGVSWGKYGFEVIGHADNGLEALQLIKTLRPDLVLTDIKMPEMNGLELIKNGKSVSPETLFVVLSGHAEFAYAQRAINYGTFGYCLKPFEIEEIHSMLARVADYLHGKLKTKSPSLSLDMYEAICSGNTLKMKQLLEDYDMPLHPNSKITPIVIQGVNLASVNHEVKHFSFSMNLRRQGFLVYDELKEAFLHSWNMAPPSGSFSAGVGYAISDVAELEASLEAASLSAYGIFSTGKTGIYPANNKNSVPINETLRDIKFALEHKDRIQFIKILESSRDLFHNLTFTIKDAYLIYTTVTYLFFHEGNQIDIRFFEGYEQLYTHYGNVDALIDDILKNSYTHFTEELPANAVKVAHKKVKEIVIYLHDNFTQEISIQGLASRFYLSPNYLCQLFKKEVGETIVEYVSRLRIQYACKLLKETDHTIQQVGEQCGFQDYFYFTRIFKRYNKITPTQYRVNK